MSLMPEPEDLGPPSPIDAGNVVAGRYVTGERYSVRGNVHLHHGASEDGLVRIAAFKYRGSEPLPRFLELLKYDAMEWGAVSPAENGRLPVIVPTLDIGRMVNATTCYWIQDDPRGPSLGDRLEQNPKFTPEYAIRIARQIGDALRTVHGAGLVHGDLDPHNIPMLANFDLIRLAWGGLASRLEAAGMDAGRGGTRTLAEVSPEVLQGKAPIPGPTSTRCARCCSG